VALAHQLSQLCHVVAQGKVGSGFDVCTAVYGSICYERYTPALLGRFLNGAEDQAAAPLTAQDILDVLDEEQWDHCALPFGLPTGIEMVLGDIAQGSSTPSMVRAFFCCGWLC
jgi:phosphomevalonate kinase